MSKYTSCASCGAELGCMALFATIYKPAHCEVCGMNNYRGHCFSSYIFRFILAALPFVLFFLYMISGPVMSIVVAVSVLVLYLAIFTVENTRAPFKLIDKEGLEKKIYRKNIIVLGVLLFFLVVALTMDR